MELFSHFPQIVYNDQLIKDITIRLDFIQRIKDNISLFQYVQLRGGQRPVDIAEIFYGNPTLYWIVLFINDVVDPYYGWLLTDSQLWSYVNKKYSDPYATHHYEAITGSL